MNHPLVSVIVPFHNVELYLEDCVASLLKTDLPLELILVNDGSDDGSGGIAESYARQYPNVILIEQEHAGPSRARNQGLDAARGEYVSFIDSDDWVADGSLKRLYDTAKDHRADMVLGDMVYAYSGQTSPIMTAVPEDLLNRVFSGTRYFISLMENSLYYPMACSYLYRREFIEDHRLRFEEGIIHEDELWTLIALCRAQRAVLACDAPFYFYRKRPGSIMHTPNRKHKVQSLSRIVDCMSAFSNLLQEPELKSWIYVNMARLHTIRLLHLSEGYDSSLSGAHPASLPGEGWNSMVEDAKLRYDRHMVRAGTYAQQYRDWCDAPQNRYLRGLSPEELRAKKIILFYNNAREYWNDLRQWDVLPGDYAVTDDRRYADQAYAVVFDLPHLLREMSDDIEKPDGQLWISWSMECEENYPAMKDPEIRSLFDIHVNHRQDADVLCPYYLQISPSNVPRDIRLNERKQGVCMLVSSSINQSGRKEYLGELMKHLPIDSYGKLYQNKELEADNGLDSKLGLYAQYRFVIAFENAIASDYVTEKFYDPLLAGAVPVYLGAPNIEDFVPGDRCYIDVRDFESPKALAAYLERCLNDDREYMKYHAWRNQPWRESFLQKIKAVQSESVIVRLCNKLASQGST